jgi:hypothetical protein
VVRGQLEAFRQGLKEYGWIEGQNISIECSTASRTCTMAAISLATPGRLASSKAKFSEVAVICPNPSSVALRPSSREQHARNR